MLAEKFHKLLSHHQRKGIGLVVVVAERHVRFTDILKSHSESSFVAYYADLAELDGGKRVGYDGESGYARCPGAHYVTVVQGHFERLVVVLVVHIVDDFQRVDINLGKPAHHLLEFVHDLVVLEEFARNRGVGR